MILSTTARLLLPVFLIFSLFLLIRGHDAPGGGFTGGLVASAGVVLYAMANGPRIAHALFRIDLKALIGVGLLLALGSALLPMALGRSFFEGVWIELPIGTRLLKLGTPTAFDTGVYLVVVGVVLTIMLARAEEEG